MSLDEAIAALEKIRDQLGFPGGATRVQINYDGEYCLDLHEEIVVAPVIVDGADSPRNVVLLSLGGTPSELA